MGTGPSAYTPKSITLFLDGTWQSARQTTPTNVALLHQTLGEYTPDGKRQLGYYFDGVGSLGSAFQRAVAGLTGYGIDDIIKDAYKRLVTTYRPGDDINLVGFSRGGTIARNLAGMIHKVGLIDERNINSEDELDALIDQAYELYRNHDFNPGGDDVTPERDDAEYFRHVFSYTDGTTENNSTATINNLLCFDTVGSLGMPSIFPGADIINEPFKFYDNRIPPSVKNAYELIAADEMREAFTPTEMRVGLDNNTTHITKLYLPGDHGAVGGGKLEYKGLSDYAATRAIELLSGNIAFAPDKVAQTFQPDIYSNPLTSSQFYEETNESWAYWIANLINGKKMRPSPSCNLLHRQCTEIDPSIRARFNKFVIMPDSLEPHKHKPTPEPAPDYTHQPALAFA